MFNINMPNIDKNKNKFQKNKLKDLLIVFYNNRKIKLKKKKMNKRKIKIKIRRFKRVFPAQIRMFYNKKNSRQRSRSERMKMMLQQK